MFPLGTVLFPSAILPLHVFEPRYQALVRHCLATEPEFGVTLIERGSEVGGGDTRTDVGTVARILEATEMPDGRWVLATAGIRRIRVVEWLPDDPFPRAEVVDWLDRDHQDPPPHGEYDEVVSVLRRTLALAAELDLPAAPATVELDPDPLVGSYQVAALAPFGPADHQRLLREGSASERLSTARRLLDEESQFLSARLAGG